MPELPEVETVRRGLAPVLVGNRILRVEARRLDLRWPLPKNFAGRLEGRRVIELKRRAKYLLAHLDDGQVWIIHLGMSGRLVIQAAASPHADLGGSGVGGPARAAHAHDHIRITTESGASIVYNDTRRFGMMDLVSARGLDRHRLLAGLGPEPLAPEFDGKMLAARVAGKRTPLKSALLDQRVIAGLGNIYVLESLYRARLSPRRLASRLSAPRADALAAAIRSVLEEAVTAGGSSLRDYVQSNGELGTFQHRFAVYDRAGEPCPDCPGRPVCKGGIRRIVQAGRASFYCPLLQR
jgi:formamidopyrimidine-DNA glycosylase